MTVSKRFKVLVTLEKPVEFWNVFKHETLEVSREWIGEKPWSRNGFVSGETLANIKESCTPKVTRMLKVI